MTTTEDKLVARCLREVANYQHYAPNGNVTADSHRTLHKRADELDPPEDRATRIAKRYLEDMVLDANSVACERLRRILREEGMT
jgi:hypothetical protein